ncbi:MAG: CvpA family protein [Acidobacteria bacterium]|nr:MAG: CvpA family protein [Acidobacteriota bacterium]
MNALDITIAAIFVGAVLYGLVRGFVRIAIGLAGLAISLAAALRLAERGPDWFSGVFVDARLARLTAFVVVLAAGLLTTAVVAFVARRLVRAAQVSWVDRLVGAALGAIGALLAVAGLLVGLTTFLPAGAPLIRESRLVPVVMGVADLAAAILPPRMADEYERRRRALDDHGAATTRSVPPRAGRA